MKFIKQKLELFVLFSGCIIRKKHVTNLPGEWAIYIQINHNNISKPGSLSGFQVKNDKH